MPTDTLPDAVVEEIARALCLSHPIAPIITRLIAGAREAGVQQGLDMAAGVAESEARDCKTGTIEHSTAWTIAAAIRKLGGDDASNVK